MRRLGVDGAGCVPSDRHTAPYVWDPEGHTAGRASATVVSPPNTTTAQTLSANSRYFMT
jgi:hypothetical protein